VCSTVYLPRENVNSRSDMIILGPKISTHHSGKNKNQFCAGVTVDGRCVRTE